MKHVVLEAIEDSEGELGLSVDGMKIINYPTAAQEGFLIAHDLLEHVNGIESVGSIDDELEAMGGCWFVRGQSGQMNRNGYGSMHSPEENIASDVCNLGRIFNGGVDFRNPIPKTIAGDAEDAIQEIMSITRKSLRSELSDGEMNRKRFNFYMDNAIHFIRTGYRKARRRHKDSWRVNSMFWNIAEAVDPYAKHVEFVGAQYKLSYDDGRAYVEEFYPEEY